MHNRRMRSSSFQERIRSLNRDELAHLEEICRLAAGELEQVDITRPVDQATARRLIRRKWLADLLRDYAAKLRGQL